MPKKITIEVNLLKVNSFATDVDLLNHDSNFFTGPSFVGEDLLLVSDAHLRNSIINSNVAKFTRLAKNCVAIIMLPSTKFYGLEITSIIRDSTIAVKIPKNLTAEFNGKIPDDIAEKFGGEIPEHITNSFDKGFKGL